MFWPRAGRGVEDDSPRKLSGNFVPNARFHGSGSRGLQPPPTTPQENLAQGAARLCQGQAVGKAAAIDGGLGLGTSCPCQSRWQPLNPINVTAESTRVLLTHPPPQIESVFLGRVLLFYVLFAM